MYVIKNAWKTITRNKGRNILIGVIILVISASSCVALAIRTSAEALIKSYESKYDVEAIISVNRQNIMKNFDPESDNRDELIDNFDSVQNLTIEEIKNYSESSYVSSYYYTYSIGLNGNNIDSASMQKDSDTNSNRMPGGMGRTFQGQSNTDFKVIGYSSLEAMNDFIEGSYTITQGEVSTEDNTCVINSELATLNNISVGDTIKLADPEDDDNIFKLTVTGIFDESSDNEDSQMSMFSNSVNNIITTTKTAESIVSTNDELDTTITPTFILNNKDDILSFQNELYSKGMNESLSLTTNLDLVENATSTISNVSSFAATFLIVVLVIGSVVLLVLNAINIRERKYEIGVLRTIGMKKGILTLQFMFELLIITIVALGVGATAGSFLSVPVSNKILQSEINSSQEQTSEISQNFGRDNNNSFNRRIGINTIQAFDSIDAAVNFKVLGELLAIGMGLTILSSLASLISIQKFSPLTILKERG